MLDISRGIQLWIDIGDMKIGLLLNYTRVITEYVMNTRCNVKYTVKRGLNLISPDRNDKLFKV